MASFFRLRGPLWGSPSSISSMKPENCHRITETLQQVLQLSSSNQERQRHECQANRAFSEKENYINTKEPQLQVSMLSHYLQHIELCFVRRHHFRREQRPPPLPWPSWRLQPRALRPDRGGRRRRSRSRGPVCLRQKRQG